MIYAERLPQIVAFPGAIGIPVEVTAERSDGFLPGIRIANGTLTVDPARCKAVGDVLHEAGHLATMPAKYRAQVTDDLEASLHAVAMADPAAPPIAEREPAERLALESGEWMAIAWSFAALVALDLPSACTFFPGAYGTTEDQDPGRLVQQLQLGFQPGVLILAKAGMTGPNPLFTHYAPDNTLPPYPAMHRWVQV